VAFVVLVAFVAFVVLVAFVAFVVLVALCKTRAFREVRERRENERLIILISTKG